MRYVFLILFLMAGLFSFSQSMFEAEWKKVDSLSNLGQPRSALEIVGKIYSESRAKGNTSQFLKAILYKMSLNSTFTEETLEKSIQSVEADLAGSEAPLSNILHSVLAELYWRYYQNNRYTFLDRTHTVNYQPEDIRTWDMRRLVSKCSEEYFLSLANPEILKKTAIDGYDPILVSKPGSRMFRPSLFDFLAHRAIDFFSNSEAGITQPAEPFTLDQPGFFAPTTEFIQFAISTSDSISFKFQAIRLLQSVISFHATDTEPSALIDAELKRLGFVHRHSSLAEKDSLYLRALRELEARFHDHASSAEVIFAIASQLVNTGKRYNPQSDGKYRWDLREAMLLLDDAIRRFPGSFGAENAAMLKEQILQRSLDLNCDFAALPGKPALGLLSYRNTSQVHFRLFRMDPSEDRKIAEGNNDDLVSGYRDRKPELNWVQNVPDPGDYQLHHTEIRLPGTGTGYYILLACTDDSFSKESIVAINRFWRTELSYIDRRNDNGSYEVFVLDRKEGKPVANCRVQRFYREYDNRSRSTVDRAGSVFYSDMNGLVTMPSEGGKSWSQYYLVFSYDKDQLITESYFSDYNYQGAPPRKAVTTHFFTDRAIYRPGQTIYFKGIVTEKEGREVNIRPDYSTEVLFYDANYQKISSVAVASNSYGSFSGSFIIPAGVLTGMMTLQCETGAISVSVEEYKRPVFEVVFQPVTGSYKLGEEVIVKGKAVSYAGSNLTDAAVTYRVVRTARFPYSWWWRGWLPESPETEIAHGSLVTDAEGNFSIPFKAIPDKSLDVKYNPVFNYQVHASVTDLNGETHEAETRVSVGKNALLLDVSIGTEVNLTKPFSFALHATNLNGQEEPARGKITIWKLKEPAGVLLQRQWTRPDQFILDKKEFEKDFPYDVYDNELDYTRWDKEKVVYSYEFDTKADSLLSVNDASRWEPGRYLYLVEGKDVFGEKVENQGSFLAWSETSKRVPGKEAAWFTVPVTRIEPGNNATVVIGSAFKNVRVLFEVMQNSRIIERKFLNISEGQIIESVPVTENERGNFTVNVVFVKMNRSWQFTKTIEVPWTNKMLDLKFGSFRSRLQPGQDEEWQITVSNSKGEKVLAEMLAGMYDASLDAFVPHSWNFNILNYFNQQHQWNHTPAFGYKGSVLNRYYYPSRSFSGREYDKLNWFGFDAFSFYSLRSGATDNKILFSKTMKEAPMAIPAMAEEMNEMIADEVSAGEKGLPPEATGNAKPAAEPVPTKIRSDFKETAFFYPQLSTNEQGEVLIRFKMPESLTRWKMMGLAVSKDLSTGMVEKSLVTQKDLMVFPNVPRFFREGDHIEFTTKISNLTDTGLNGNARLELFDAYTMQPLGKLVMEGAGEQVFQVPSKGNTVVHWDLQIPEGLQAIVYRCTAVSGSFSDGEEAAVPVLPNRMLVTESLPLPVNAGQTRSFTFGKLVDQGKNSSTLRNYRLSLEVTSNPVWYAVQALPYLMEYPYECAEQVFSRYYANSIATHIANSSPKIKTVFDSWRNLTPDALKSNLEKNQELKSILLAESPWVREADNESERKQRIAILFDLNRMSNELDAAFKTLKEMQKQNGGWPWFKGMPDNRYITQHIVCGLGHLDKLGIHRIMDREENRTLLQRAIAYLDDRAVEELENLKKDDKDYLKNDHLSYEAVHYLYTRSYFKDAFPLDKRHAEAFDYFKGQAVKFWKSRNNYTKGMIALALNRYSETKTARLVMRSLSETALYNDEMGMYWRNERYGWMWHQAPVETQAMLIEAYSEVMQDQESVEKLKIWLLKQKQTQDWKTTKATADAVYALLLRGMNLLANDQPVEVKLGDILVDPGKLEGDQKPEAGTGYYKTSWSGSDIRPEMGNITVSNPNQSVAWGSVYWQYYEQLDKITFAETPMKLSKKLFREVNTATGPVIEPIDGTTLLRTGDKVVVRIELRSDRDMEYVHLKDMRAAAFEPLNVLSGYRWQGGLGYYEATKDASSNFFISYLPKGTYVFEYRLFATQKGEFSNGITTVQCMYAPEFSAHSEGIRVRVE